MTLAHRIYEAALARSLKSPEPGTLGARLAKAEADRAAGVEDLTIDLRDETDEEDE